MAVLLTSDLEEFRQFALAHGDAAHPEVAARYGQLELRYDTVVDQTLDPFSDEYLTQQLALYREVSGRDFDQSVGELHPGDFEPNVMAPNPLNIRDAADMGEHARVISTMLSLACLEGEAEVLDLGAGHGLSSELFAFAGCRVTAIDIDPVLGALSRRRAEMRGLPITRQLLNFEDLSPIENGCYSAALFYQAFHHCLRPWDLIARLRPKLRDDGVIAFAGEPMQTTWWRHWGLRLDPVSLFVARHHGWFESGWSHAFIRSCFAREGMMLTFFTGGHGGGEIGVATSSAARRGQVVARAESIGLTIVEPGLNIKDSSFFSHSGTRERLFGRPGFRQRDGDGGTLLFGPYVDLAPGDYEVSLLVHRDAAAHSKDRTASLILDAAGDRGETIYFKEELAARRYDAPRLIVRRLSLPQGGRGIEIRAAPRGSALWSVSLPTVRPI